jgi:hypothetical protein
VDGHIGARDCRSAGSTIGLDDIAIQRDSPLTECLQVSNRSQAAADQALDFLSSSALFAARSLTIGSRVRRAGQHPIFGRQPPLALALQKARHAVLDARSAKHTRIAEGNQDRAFGMTRKAAFQSDGPQLIWRPATGAGGWR